MIGGIIARRGLPILRRVAESRMTLEVRIERTTRTRDNSTGNYVDTPHVVYRGRARIQTYEAYEQTPEAGAHVAVAMRLHLHLPADVTGVLISDYATVESAQDPASADLVSRTYRIAGDVAKVDATARRYPIEWTATNG